MAEDSIETKNGCWLDGDACWARLWEKAIPLNKLSLRRDKIPPGGTVRRPNDIGKGGQLMELTLDLFQHLKKLEKRKKLSVLRWVTSPSSLRWGEGWKVSRQSWMNQDWNEVVVWGTSWVNTSPHYLLFLNWRYFNSRCCPHMGIFHSMSLWCSHKYSTFPASTCCLTSSFTGGNKVQQREDREEE